MFHVKINQGKARLKWNQEALQESSQILSSQILSTVAACKTGRNGEDKSYFNKVSLYRTLCVKFCVSTSYPR